MVFVLARSGFIVRLFPAFADFRDGHHVDWIHGWVFSTALLPVLHCCECVLRHVIPVECNLFLLPYRISSLFTFLFPPLSLSLSLPHSFSPSPSLSLTLSLPLPLPLSPSLSLPLPLLLSLSLPPSLPLSLLLSLPLSHTHRKLPYSSAIVGTPTRK